RARTKILAGGAGRLAIVVASLAPSFAQPRAAYIVGAKTFTEQYILEALIEARLQAAGLSARRRDGLGSTIIFDALAAGDIDVYVDYSGTLWTTQMHRTDAKPREEVLDELRAWLAGRRMELFGALGFEKA